MLNPPRRGKRKPEYLQWLASLARAQSDADALSVHLERGAVNLADFAWHGSSTAKGCANCCNSLVIFRLVTAC